MPMGILTVKKPRVFFFFSRTVEARAREHFTNISRALGRRRRIWGNGRWQRGRKERGG